VRLLLDTHAMIWFTGDPEQLTPGSRAAIVDADTVAVSAASIWEVATKASLGKLDPPAGDFPDALREWGFELLAITPVHAWAVRALPAIHRDPFDRMLVVQARLEGRTIVTRDPQIARYDVSTLAA
jgi:PIN domain nuclease of toxin-antitoxin system